MSVPGSIGIRGNRKRSAHVELSDDLRGQRDGMAVIARHVAGVSNTAPCFEVCHLDRDVMGVLVFNEPYGDITARPVGDVRCAVTAP